MLTQHEEKINALTETVQASNENNDKYRMKNDDLLKDMRLAQDKHTDKISSLEEKIRQISMALGDVVKVNPEVEKEQEEMIRTVR